HWMREFTLITRKGERRICQVLSSMLEAGRAISVVTDITDRKRLESEREKLRTEREERDRWLATVVTALDSSEDRIAIVGSNQRILYANRALLDTVQVPGADTSGAQLTDLFPQSEDRENIKAQIQRAIAG